MTKPVTSGDLEFRFRSNRPSLDFVATLGERGHRDIERIPTGYELADWLVHAGLVLSPPIISNAEHQEAINLREAMNSVLVSVTQPCEIARPDINEINDFARRPPLTPVLSGDARSCGWRADAPFHATLSSLARDFIELLATYQPERIKRCADKNCCMFFLDTTRAGTRRWCATDGKGCGNKAKRRAFSARQRAKLVS